jgi:NAD(P)-dependent dehydrogenase (short-subunit alcohol dehydrogenase family)/uncharacterized OB-fold protein
MKKRPDLPPRARTRPARRLTSAATRGRLELPVCQACRSVQYPVGEICGACLSNELRWESVEATGTLLSSTVIRHATEAYFQKQRPILMGSVRLDAGPVVLARLSRECTRPGTRVVISNQLDRSGEAILCASAKADEAVENILADPNRDIEGKVVLITGANGGIGRELVAAFRKAGAEVIAASRAPVASAEAGTRSIALDVANRGSVEAAAVEIGPRVDILINNAGTTAIAGFLEGDDISGARSEMEVNYFGTLSMIRAFAPHLKAKKRGVIVNMLSALGHVCLPTMGSYCASKAAAWSLTQGIRAELLPWGVRVCAVFPTTVDTAASADSPPPKLSPAFVAREVVRMIRDGEEDLYPGNIAQDLIEALRQDSKTVEREMSLMLPEPR